MNSILPVEDRLKFFVYVVESPSAPDLYHRRSEGDLLRQAINLNQIHCVLRLAVNLEAFSASLKIGLTEAMEQMPNTVPILHISAHGYKDGIQLSSGEFLGWDELRELLIPINQALSGALILCMSTCEGYSGQQMAMVEHSSFHPFFAIIGNSGKPTWPETAVAFSSFYHLVANGRFLKDAVEAMAVASGNESFFITTANESQTGYLEYLKRVNVPEAIDTMEQGNEVVAPSELSKFKLLSSD
jgi:hypothetical protein